MAEPHHLPMQLYSPFEVGRMLPSLPATGRGEGGNPSQGRKPGGAVTGDAETPLPVVQM